MRLKIEDARALVERVMTAQGYAGEDAAIIADHIIDCELRGVNYGGLARVVSIVERLRRTGPPERGVELLHETAVSARLAGHDNLGYVVARKATELACAKAGSMGLALVLPTEIYEALKRGSMDCSYLTNANFIAYKLHEVAKYIIDVRLGGINAYWLAMNRSKFFSLPENIQTLLREAGAEATQYSVDITVAEEEAALQQMVAEGAEVITFEEQEAIEAAVPDMIDIWIDNMTEDGKGEEAKAYAAELKALLGM